MSTSKLYCVLAAKGLGLHNSGRTYLCCHSRKYLEDQQGEQIYLDTHTLEDAWASPTRREIQTALEQGVEHPNCQACWDDEHAGKKSRRQIFNDMALMINERDDQPQILDLKMGNTCNMRCRTCNPEVSSQWYREDWELTVGPRDKISYQDYLPRWRRIPASYGEDNVALWSTMRRWIPNTVYIDYYGAEPMLIRKNFEILQHAVDQGRAGSIDLHFSTNGTIWNQDLEDLLRHFRTIWIDLSIDDIGSRCGYIRYPSTWQQVEPNLHQLLATQKKYNNFRVGVCVTVNSLNIYYLPEIFDYFAGLDLAINFNMLHLPWYLNVKSLPELVKSEIARRMLNHAYSGNGWFQRYAEGQRNTLINFLLTPAPSQDYYWREFAYYLRELDRTRNQDYRQALPEFAQLIQPWLDEIV